MTRTTAAADPQLIAFTVPGIPASVRIARSHVQAALSLHGLGEFAGTAAAVASELVTNAGAPRGALSYPRPSREELEGGFWV
ncbi:MAG: hypothetical protein ACRDOL_31965 [Streptosporangiaceae bacterium]